jgi:hypothetical protein
MRPINSRLADNAYQAGYLLQHMRGAAERLERGISPTAVAKDLREVIEKCEHAVAAASTLPSQERGTVQPISHMADGSMVTRPHHLPPESE